MCSFDFSRLIAHLLLHARLSAFRVHHCNDLPLVRRAIIWKNLDSALA
jgi:hypothetical protein